MKNLSYQTYRTNPEIRREIEREVSRARAEAFGQYIVMPLLKIFSKLFGCMKTLCTLIHLKTGQVISHG